MPRRGLRRALEFGNDTLGKGFAEFHAPLVEGIDLPNRTLGKYRVLIKGDQLRRSVSGVSR